MKSPEANRSTCQQRMERGIGEKRRESIQSVCEHLGRQLCSGTLKVNTNIRSLWIVVFTVRAIRLTGLTVWLTNLIVWPRKNRQHPVVSSQLANFQFFSWDFSRFFDRFQAIFQWNLRRNGRKLMEFDWKWRNFWLEMNLKWSWRVVQRYFAVFRHFLDVFQWNSKDIQWKMNELNWIMDWKWLKTHLNLISIKFLFITSSSTRFPLKIRSISIEKCSIWIE